MDKVVRKDAEEFGVHIKQGGWRLGLLVARNVEPGKGQGARKPRNARSKVSAREFASQAGTSHPRVVRHLEAWEAAAAAGHVPHADTLSPGTEIDLDVALLPEWEGFYPRAGTDFSRADEQQRERWQEAADEEGSSPQEIARVASSRRAIAGAIKSDPKARQAAARAIRESQEKEWEESQAAARKRTNAKRRELGVPPQEEMGDSPVREQYTKSTSEMWVFTRLAEAHKEIEAARDALNNWREEVGPGYLNDPEVHETIMYWKNELDAAWGGLALSLDMEGYYLMGERPSNG